MMEIRGGIVVFKDSIQDSTGDAAFEPWLPKLFLLLTDSSPAFPFPPLLPPSLSKPESDPGFPVVWKLMFRVYPPTPFDHRTTLVQYPATPQTSVLATETSQE
jgi:hypothetical protein